MHYGQDLKRLLGDSQTHIEALANVAAHDLPDSWIGAGFIRNLVWDALHDLPNQPQQHDVDVIWYNQLNANEAQDRLVEAELRNRMPMLRWSVKNQARMHLRNSDRAYASSEDAMRHWPETATAVAARVGPHGKIELIAPFGLADIFNMVVRPTPHFAQHKMTQFCDRAAQKRWRERYPKVNIAAA